MSRHYQDTESRRRQIAEAALQVIAEEGLGRFTTRAIAARVGLTDGALFRHFRSKEDIVLAAMELLEAALTDSEVPTDDDALDRLEALFRSRATFVGAQHAVGRLVFSDQLLHVAGPEGRDRLRRWHARNLELLGRCVAELEAEGRLVDGVSVDDAVRLVQGQVMTFAVRRILGGGDALPLEAQVDRAWDTLRRLLFH